MPPDAAKLALLDPEGTPLAILTISERSVVVAAATTRTRRAARAPGQAGRAAWSARRTVSLFRDPEHGPFRQLRQLPAQVRAELGDGPVLAFATGGR